MYWLLDYAEQENLRQRMIRLQSTILNRQPRDRSFSSGLLHIRITARRRI